MEITEILRQIDSLKKEAESLQPAKPEWERVFWDKFSLEFNYNSNHMEGNTMTYGHTQILLKSGDIVGKYNSREIKEMEAHNLALKIILESANDPNFELSEKFIREINQTILVEPFYKEAITSNGQPTMKRIEPGRYKQLPNSVLMQNGEVFHYSTPEETPALMGDLMDWYEKETKANELHLVQIAALFHYKIVRIHPFDDSNGRTARLLMNFILLQNGYTPLVIESTDKKNYLIALNEADAGNIEAFVEYITNLALRWHLLYVKALKGEKIGESKDFEKEIEILKRKLLSKEKTDFHISEEIVSETLEHSIFPLLYNLSNKLSQLGDFFKSNRIEVEITNTKSSTPLNSFSRPLIDEILKRIKSTTLELRNGGILKIKFCHNGLKKSSNTPAVVYNTALEIVFKQNVYKISFPGTPINSLEFFYGKYLSEANIYELTDELSKNELDTLKKYIT